MSSSKVDAYIEGSEMWPDIMRALRPIALDAGLSEEIKWGKPCYSHGDKNILIFQEMKNFLAVMFFKGALLDDPAGVLTAQGPNTRSAKRIEFTSGEQVSDLAAVFADYIDQAIANEDAGLEVPADDKELELVAELRDRLNADPELRAAFEELTPGRQRGYNLYFSDAKKSATRASRVEKYIPKILAGKGFHDR